eukprot:15201887-Ditylum_brightwellii.AAC.1
MKTLVGGIFVVEHGCRRAGCSMPWVESAPKARNRITCAPGKVRCFPVYVGQDGMSCFSLEHYSTFGRRQVVLVKEGTL